MFITIPAACFFLFPIQFAFGAVTVGEVAASGGSTKDHASVKAARKLRRGEECSPSFQIEKNANKIDYGILQTCPEDKDCVDDHTSSLGGRCVESEMSSDGITSASAPTPCTFANGTQGSKCTGDGACVDSNITGIGCGSCHGSKTCRFMAANTIIGENSCHGRYACLNTSGTIGDSSCLGEKYPCYRIYGNVGDGSCHEYSACDQFGGNNTIDVGNDSCRGNKSCFFRFGDRAVGDSSCNGDRACRKTYAVIGDSSCNSYEACYNSTFVNDVIGNCQCNENLTCSGVIDVDKSADLCTKPPTRAPSSKSSKKMPGSKSSKMTKVAKMTNIAVSLSGDQFEGLSVPPEVSMPFSF